MPETENRTLEDIEMHFSDNKRKLTDIYIRKAADITNLDARIRPANAETGLVATIGQPLAYTNQAFNGK